MIGLPKYVKDTHVSSYTHTHTYIWASQVALVVKNPPAGAGDMRRRFDPWVGKIPWRRAWQPTPIFFPRESSGQRSMVGTESDTTEVT